MTAHVLLRAVFRVRPRHATVEVANHFPMRKQVLNGRNVRLGKRGEKKSISSKTGTLSMAGTRCQSTAIVSNR